MSSVATSSKSHKTSAEAIVSKPRLHFLIRTTPQKRFELDNEMIETFITEEIIILVLDAIKQIAKCGNVLKEL